MSNESDLIVSGGPPPPHSLLNEIFFEAIDGFDKTDALQFKRGTRYEPVSHAEILRRVGHAAIGLNTLGVVRGDRVAILSENRPEWAIADYACLTSGVTDVPIYPTLPADQVAYILNDSGAVAIFVSTLEQADKIVAIRSQVPALRSVIAFDELRTAVELTLS